MSLKKSLALAAAGALLAVPCLAAIKAMTLAELMGMTTDAVHVTILSSSTFHAPSPFTGDDAAWTRLAVAGESLTSGQPVSMDVVFLGSHDPADRYAVSEMPTLQQTRVGAELVAFYHLHDGTHGSDPAAGNVIHNHAELFRVERGFGAAVVVGGGNGSAFPDNIKLDDARNLVRVTHLQLEAASRAAGGAGEGK